MTATMDAIEAALAADTRSSTVDVGSTTTVLQLGAGEAVAWLPRDIVHLTGSGATAANHLLTRTIKSVDIGADTIAFLTRDALPVAPAAGDIVRGGFAFWVRPANSTEKLLYRSPRSGQLPLARLLPDSSDPHVVADLVLGLERTDQVERQEERYRLNLYGHSPRWLEGAVVAIRRIFRGNNRNVLAIAGSEAWEARFTLAYPLERDDAASGVCEWLVEIVVATAPVYA